MVEYTRQHFVPESLLKKWCNEHGELYRFRYGYKGLEVEPKSPRSVGYEHNLLNFRHRRDIVSHYMESSVFGQVYDNEGAVSLNCILDSDITRLSRDQEEAWARFIVSILIRTPEIVKDRLRSQGDTLRRLLRQSQSDYENLRGSNDPLDIVDYLDLHKPGYADDVGITIIPRLVDLMARRIMEEMEWCVPNEGVPNFV